MSRRDAGLAVLVALLWGLNFLAIHEGLAAGLPPLLLAALRFVVAALPALWLPRPPLPAGRLVAIGLVLFAAQFALLFTGMAAGMTAGLASVTQQSQAFFTVLLAAAVLRERPGRRALAGMGVAFLGLVVIATTAGGGGVTPLGFGLCLGAAVAWGAGNVLLRGAGRAVGGPVALMAWLSLVPVGPLLLLSFWLEGRPGAALSAVSGAGWRGLGAVLYLAFAATLGGYALWGALLARHPAAAVAPFSLLVPPLRRGRGGPRAGGALRARPAGGDGADPRRARRLGAAAAPPYPGRSAPAMKRR